MKKYAWLAVIAFGLFFGAAQAQLRYIEGTDYVPLEHAIDGSESPKVIEFFWYGCPHCYHVVDAVHKWDTEHRPADVVFEMVPAAVGRWELGAQLFYTAKALGLHVNQDIFDAVHQNHDNGIIMDADKAKAYLVSKGADKQAVDKAWDSFQVKQDLERAKKLFKESGLEGVPSFVVNGQYKVLSQQDNPGFEFFDKLSALPTWLSK